MDVKTRSLVVCSLLCWGCTSSQPKPTPSEEPHELNAKVKNHQLFADDKGKPGKPVSVFDYRQRTLHFRVFLDSRIEGAKSKWVFTAKSTAAGNNRQIQSSEAEINGDALEGTLAFKENWPVGTYHVDIIVDDNPFYSFDYDVTGEQSRIVFLGHSLGTDDGQGLPKGPVKEFHTTDRVLHLQVTTKGIDTTEPEIVWTLHRLKRNGDEAVASADQPRMRLQDSVLRASFQSKADWKPGQYRADVHMNGKVVHSFEFMIERS